MLTAEELKKFIENDSNSKKKKMMGEGVRYYEGEHDILKRRLFYFNANGDLIEDKLRSNIKISHPFFTELVDQAAQYILSNTDGIFHSDQPELQAQLDEYFNNNEDFEAELLECVTGTMIKGHDFMFAYMTADGKTAFQFADSIGVVEVDTKNAGDKQRHIIYHYLEKEDKDGNRIRKIQDWTKDKVAYWQEAENGGIQPDEELGGAPIPHIVKVDENGDRYDGGNYGMIPFFRLDNNKKQFSDLKPIKGLIDDYDLMASSLSNNLADFDTPIYVVRGFSGDNLDELQHNLKTKKTVGVDSEGGIDVQTVDVPFEARKTKLELDEKNIYRFGMGLNTAGLKDTAATTNIAIKAAYSLLDLKCSKFTTRLKQMLRKMLRLVLDEINRREGTDYRPAQVYFMFKPEVMSNASENAQNKLTEAQEQQVRINTLLELATYLGDEVLMQNICEILDIDYEEIKNKLPDPDEAKNQLGDAKNILEGGDPTEPEPDDPMDGIDE